jgi:hypothetical protein
MGVILAENLENAKAAAKKYLLNPNFRLIA